MGKKRVRPSAPKPAKPKAPAKAKAKRPTTGGEIKSKADFMKRTGDPAKRLRKGRPRSFFEAIFG
jgi:hypothetical protein